MTDVVKNGPIPRYYQLQEIIREKVQAGAWPPGRPIPSEREFAEQYGISRMTARQSITELVNEGLLYREQGRGTFVGRPKIDQQLRRLTSFTEDMERRRQRPGAKVLEAEMYRADDVVAERLRIRAGQKVVRLRRLRLADGEPLAVETSFVSFIGCERLLDEDLEQQSLYGLLEARHNLPPLEADQELEAGVAGADEAAILHIAVGGPVLLTRRVTYTHRNQPIEYATSIYRGDKYRFSTRLVRGQQ